MEEGPDVASNGTVWLGICISIVGTFAGALGTFILKTRPILGVLLMTLISATCELTAMHFAPLSILSSMASLNIMWTILLNSFVNVPETAFLVKYILFAMISTTGIACIIRFGPTHDPDARLDFTEKHTHIVLTFIIGTIVTLLAFFVVFITRKRRSVLEAMLPGCIAGATQTTAKITIEAAAQKHSSFITMAILCIFFATSQLFLVYYVVTKFGSLRTNVIYITTLIVSVLVASALAFDEINITDDNVELFALGFVMTIAGAVLLNRTEQQERNARESKTPPNPTRESERDDDASTSEVALIAALVSTLLRRVGVRRTTQPAPNPTDDSLESQHKSDDPTPRKR